MHKGEFRLDCNEKNVNKIINVNIVPPQMFNYVLYMMCKNEYHNDMDIATLLLAREGIGLRELTELTIDDINIEDRVIGVKRRIGNEIKIQPIKVPEYVIAYCIASFNQMRYIAIQKNDGVVKKLKLVKSEYIIRPVKTGNLKNPRIEGRPLGFRISQVFSYYMSGFNIYGGHQSLINGQIVYELYESELVSKDAFESCLNAIASRFYYTELMPESRAVRSKEYIKLQLYRKYKQQLIDLLESGGEWTKFQSVPQQILDLPIAEPIFVVPEEPESEPKRRGRGRPPKPKEPDSIPVIQDGDEPVPKRRGRPPKPKNPDAQQEDKPKKEKEVTVQKVTRENSMEVFLATQRQNGKYTKHTKLVAKLMNDKKSTYEKPFYKLTEEEAAKFIARWRIKSAEEIEEWISIASDYCDLMIKNRFGTANPFKNLNLQKITEAGV